VSACTQCGLPYCKEPEKHQAPEPIKPLHVRVAEALGWSTPRSIGNWMIPGEPDNYVGRPPSNVLIGSSGYAAIPRYDTDWSATGPLIERLRLDLQHGWDPDEPAWTAYAEKLSTMEAYGSTPLLAVCNLILALSAAGKLPSRS